MTDPNEPQQARPYDVGYGKPPKHSQFKKGKSGNPKGRSCRIYDPIASGRRALKRRIKVQRHGCIANTTYYDLFFEALMKDALAGRAHARSMVLRFLLEFGMQDTAFGMPVNEEIIRAKRLQDEINDYVRRRKGKRYSPA